MHRIIIRDKRAENTALFTPVAVEKAARSTFHDPLSHRPDSITNFGGISVADDQRSPHGPGSYTTASFYDCGPLEGTSQHVSDSSSKHSLGLAKVSPSLPYQWQERDERGKVGDS